MNSSPTTWFDKVRQHAEAEPEGWFRCPGLNKTEAEQLLDWLEANGYSQREVTYTAEQGFLVRWHR